MWRNIAKIKVILTLALVLSPGSLAAWGAQTPEPITITMVVGAAGKKFEVLQRPVMQFKTQQSHIQTRRAAYQDPDVLAANPHLAELFDILVAAKPHPIHPGYPEISEIMAPEVHRTLTSQQDAAADTEAMATAIQTIISNPIQEITP